MATFGRWAGAFCLVFSSAFWSACGGSAQPQRGCCAADAGSNNAPDASSGSVGNGSDGGASADGGSDAGSGSDGGSSGDAGSGSDGGSSGADAGCSSCDGGADAGPANPPGPPTPVLIPPSGADVQHFPGPNLLSASYDDGGYLWGVSSDALWLLRPGASSWEKYPNALTGGVANNGYQNNGLLSVAGAAAGEAWVGYAGVFQDGTENDDPATVPLNVRESGGADHLFATATGIALDSRTFCQDCSQHNGHLVFWTKAGVLAAEPNGRWKVRSIWTIQVNRGPAGVAGDVFFGGNHGIAVWSKSNELNYGVGYSMEEHVHAGWNYCYPDSTSKTGWTCSLLTGDHHGLAIAPDGNVWLGADFAATRLDYMDKPSGDFYTTSDPGDPGKASPTAFRTWAGKSADVQHPEWGGRDFVMALEFDAYGDLWLGSYQNGLARVHMRGSLSTSSGESDIDYWNNRCASGGWCHAGGTPPWPGDTRTVSTGVGNNTATTTFDYVWTLKADADGSLWIGGAKGAYRFVAASGQWVSYTGVISGQNVNQVSFDPRPGHRGVLFATDQGAFVYSGK